MNTNETNEIIVTDDLGNEEHFFVVEQTVINGMTYLLVTASEDDEAEAYILKDTSAAGDEMAVYTEVEDDLEREAVAGIFRQMIEGAELR